MQKSYVVPDSFIQDVYDAMQEGEPEIFSVPGVENAFAEGEKCCNLYEQVYHAERRLEERLGVDGHDDDVETIICCLQDIQEELCFRMYHYGAKFGLREE